jgi:tetratricopeptide (TPR) repeat protein
LIGKLPFIALSIASSVLTVLAQQAGGSVTAIEAIPLSTRMLVAAKSLVAYLWKMLVPLDLIPYYPYPKEVALFSLEYLSVIAFAVAITVACVVMLKKQKRLYLSVWTYYVVTLIPVLGLVQVGGQSMADRYTYLPSIGAFLLAGLLVAWSLERLRKKTPAIAYPGAATVIFLLLFIAFLTVKQMQVWQNSLSLWTYVIEKDPDRVPLAYNNRGLAFFTLGEIEKAIGDYQTAIAQDPSYAEAYSNLGIALLKKGLADEAIGNFQTAIRLSPEFVNAHRNLAPALYKNGRITEALAHYLTVTRLRPDDPDAHADLGSAYGTIGSYDKAIEHFQIALRLRPDFVDAHYNLATAYYMTGRREEANRHYEASSRLSPGNKEPQEVPQ